jgi:peptidyl-prolyl cis-trans isomerase C
VVEVLEREAGVPQPFEAVRGAVAMALRQHDYVTALRQYLDLLAGQAALQGIEVEAEAGDVGSPG